MSSNTTLSHHYNVSSHHEKSTVDIVFYIIIVLLGSTGNSLVIWVAGFRTKPNVTNIWLVNLAAADLIFSLTRITQLIKHIFFNNNWPFGDFLCKLTGFFKYANMFCSVFLLAVISVDRVLCVCHPVFTRNKRTLRAARLVSLGVWVVALIFSSPYFVFRGIYLDQNNLSQCALKKKEANGKYSAKYIYFYIRFFCGFLFPFLMIFTCYTITAIGIRRTRLSGKSRPLRILALLVFAFFLCWAPYHILALVKMVNRNHPAVKVGWNMASNIAYFNSCVNPMLYFCMGLDLKKHCNQSLIGIFHRALSEGQTMYQDSTIEERLNVVKAAGAVQHTPI